MELLGHYLVNVIQQDVAVKWSGVTSYPIWNSNIDWHSSVHAHLALLIAGYMTNNYNWVNMIILKYTQDKVRAEMKLLEDVTFEMPYGRSWLLLLTTMVKYLGSSSLDEIGEQVYLSLVDNFAYNPYLENYDNWSFAAFAMNIYSNKHWTPDFVYLTYISDRYTDRFLSQRGMYELLLYQSNPDDLILYINYVKPQLIFQNKIEAYEPVPLTIPYSYGLNYSRIVAFCCRYAITSDEHWIKVINKHWEYTDMYITSILSPENYETVGHWVPQFVVFALAATQILL